MNILLSGIVGSVAYGLAGPDSDVDQLGIFAVPTVELHGLGTVTDTRTTTDPDCALHEARKWCSLALGCNPTVMELVWLPEDLYTVRTALGDDLIRIRRAFLSRRRVRDAYLGFARSQLKRLQRGGADARRTAKSARHMARLLHQGHELYTTGHLPVRLANPDWFTDFGARVAAGDTFAAKALVAQAEDDFAAARSALPKDPDTDTVEAWLHRVRTACWEAA